MTALEDRLTKALHARTDQVRAEDLGTAEPLAPASSPPGRRTRLVVLAAGVAAAVVIGVVVILGSGDDGDREPAGGPTASASPSDPASVPPLPRLLPADEDRWRGVGETVTFADGSLGTLGRTDLTLEFESSGQGVSLPDYLGALGSLSEVQLKFGAQRWQGPYGYLVRHTSEGYEALDVVVDSSDGLVIVTPHLDRVPFGESARYDTWSVDHGAALFTRVAVGDPSVGRFRVYRWDLAGKGRASRLVPVDLGIVCLDLGASTYERC